MVKLVEYKTDEMIIKSNLNSFVIPYLENHTVNEYESSNLLFVEVDVESDFSVIDMP